MGPHSPPGIPTHGPQDPRQSHLRLQIMAEHHLFRPHLEAHLRLSVPFSIFSPPPPTKPSISLDHLVFTLDVFDDSGGVIVTTVVEDARRRSLRRDTDGVFRFDIDVRGGDDMVVRKGVCEEEVIRVRWCVVLKDWRGVFVVMDCKGRLGKVTEGRDRRRWFTEELPSPPGCVCGGAGGGSGGDGRCGLVGELGLLGLSGDGDEVMKIKVEKVSVGLMSVACWRRWSAVLAAFSFPSSCILISTY